MHYIVYSEEPYCLGRLCMKKQLTPIVVLGILVQVSTIADSEVIVVEEILFQI